MLPLLTTGYRDVRYAYTGSKIEYMGLHDTHDEDTSDTEWLVWKYTYSGNNVVRVEGPLEGAWDNRESLGWGA